MKKGINRDRKTFLEQRQSIMPQICPGCTRIVTRNEEQQRIAQWNKKFETEKERRGPKPEHQHKLKIGHKEVCL